MLDACFSTLCMSCEAGVAMMMVMSYMKHKVLRFNNSILVPQYSPGHTMPSKRAQVNRPKIRLTQVESLAFSIPLSRKLYCFRQNKGGCCVQMGSCFCQIKRFSKPSVLFHTYSEDILSLNARKTTPSTAPETLPKRDRSMTLP